MEFGIHIGTRGCLATPANLITCAQRAEALGYALLGVPDRLVLPQTVATRYPYTEDGVWVGAETAKCLDVLGTLCFLAGVTQRIRLLPSVLVVPYRPALVAAKMLATADLLSGGRLIVGVGVGWMQEEFAAVGAPPFGRRGAVTDEYLAAFRALWTEDAPTAHGAHVTFEGLLFRPKPVQAHVPIWVGGESEAAMRRTARFGDAWYPASHNQATPFDTPDRLAGGIAKMAEVARTEGRDPGTVETAYLWFKPVEWTAQRTAEGGRRLFTGSAADMLEDVAALERIGVRRVILLTPAPTIEGLLERLERFATDVIRAPRP